MRLLLCERRLIPERNRIAVRLPKQSQDRHMQVEAV